MFNFTWSFSDYLLTEYNLSVEDARKTSARDYFGNTTMCVKAGFFPTESMYQGANAKFQALLDGVSESEYVARGKNRVRRMWQEYQEREAMRQVMEDPESAFVYADSSVNFPKAPIKAPSKVLTDNPLASIGVTHWAGSREVPDPTPFAWGNIIETDGFMQIVGGSKVGKTWFMLPLAMSVAQGVPFLGLPTTQLDVLFVNPELSENAYRRRVARVQKHYFKDQPDDVKYDEGRHFEEINLRHRSATVTQLVDYLIELGHEREILRGKPWGLICIDSIYRFLGGDENSPEAWNFLLDELGRLSIALGNIGIWYVHHAPKGSQAYKDAIDVSAGSGSKERYVDTNLVLRYLFVSTPLREKLRWNKKDRGVLVDFNRREGEEPDPMRLSYIDAYYDRADKELMHCRLRKGPQDDTAATDSSEKKEQAAAKKQQKKQQESEALWQTRFDAIKAIYKAHDTDTLKTSELKTELVIRTKLGITESSFSKTFERILQLHPYAFDTSKRGYYRLLEK